MPNNELYDNEKIQLDAKMPESIESGVYANSTLVSHTKEEFLMDFLMTSPSGGVVTARIIISPGHMKRMLKALHDNLKEYEKGFGKIKPAKEPEMIKSKPK